jgi:hypothetical protein
MNISLCQAGQNNSYVYSRLQKMAESEREQLSLFFEVLIRLDTFGYTIFGDKPISCAGYSSRLRGNFIFPIGAICYQGEALCNKYFPVFCIKNFVFKFERTDDECIVFLINKNSFLKTVGAHITEFRKVLGEEVTPEILFFQIIDNRNRVWQTLKENHCLLGLLLGYGYNNSQMFNRREEIIDLITCFPPLRALPEQIEILSEYDIESINFNRKNNNYSQTSDFDLLLSEYKNIKNMLKSTSSGFYGPLSLFSEVGFAADLDNAETKTLLERYRKTEAEIMKSFINGNLLEAILCKMTED